MSVGQTRPTIEAGLDALRRRWPGLSPPDDEQRPVFILAAGWRSGSTMLQRLLIERCLIWGEPYGHAWPIPSMADQIRCFTASWPESHHFYSGETREALTTRFIANLYPGVQDLLHAHRGFFDRLLAEPARAAGYDRWGLKEVRLDADHALYLNWLFPAARFLFLVRNPYDAWRSYAARAARGWRWYNRWPDQPLTPRSFAAHWNRLVGSFMEGHRKVGGLWVRYEDLACGRTGTVSDYLGFELSQRAFRSNPSDGGPAPLEAIPEADALAIEDELGALANSLGYCLQPPVKATEGTTFPARATRVRDRSRCVVLVPFHRFIEPACETGLRGLEHLGFVVRRFRADEGMALSCSLAVSDALRDGFEEMMWIDADMAFDSGDVDRLRSLGLPIASGVYRRPSGRGPAWSADEVHCTKTFEPLSEALEVAHAEAGFLLTRREVYLAMTQRTDLRACSRRTGGTFYPFFAPLVVRESEAPEYLTASSSFCVRARRCGFSIVCDPRVRPSPIVPFAASWEDLLPGMERRLPV